MRKKINWPARVELALLPTRIHPLRQVELSGDTEIWVKRDDETGFLLSGNKIRKLEFSLARAMALGADGVITCGGVNSNHCRATSFAAKQLGLDSHLVLRSSDGKEPESFQGNTLLNKIAGAEIHWISPDQYSARNEIMEELRAELAQQGRSFVVIPEGASDAIGALGYAYAMEELIDQSELYGVQFDYILHAMGSAGTTAGMTAARDLHNLPMTIFGVPVCDDSAYFLEAVKSIRAEMEGFGFPPFDGAGLVLEDSYVGEGYGLTTEGELAVIQDLCAQEGVLLDPCYTGKAFNCLKQELAKGRFDSNERILFWHTGGALGNFSYEDQWGGLLKK